MGTGQHEGMALLSFGVSTLPQSIGLAQEFTLSTTKIAAFNIQWLQPIFKAPVQDLIMAPKFLDADVMAKKICHRGK